MINFGAYDQRISFCQVGQVPDGYGGYEPTFQTVLITSSSVNQLKGANALEQNQELLPKTYLFKIQKRSSFKPNQSHQILYRGSYFVIKSIDEPEERLSREYLITAVKSDYNQTT
jgi:hypothetical protein